MGLNTTESTTSSTSVYNSKRHQKSSVKKRERIVEKERNCQWKERLDKALDKGVRLWAYSRHVASEVKKNEGYLKHME